MRDPGFRWLATSTKGWPGHQAYPFSWVAYVGGERRTGGADTLNEAVATARALFVA